MKAVFVVMKPVFVFMKPVFVFMKPVFVFMKAVFVFMKANKIHQNRNMEPRMDGYERTLLTGCGCVTAHRGVVQLFREPSGGVHEVPMARGNRTSSAFHGPGGQIPPLLANAHI